MKEKPEERELRIETEIAITAANEIYRRAKAAAFRMEQKYAEVVLLSDLAEICNQVFHPLELSEKDAKIFVDALETEHIVDVNEMVKKAFEAGAETNPGIGVNRFHVHKYPTWEDYLKELNKEKDKK